MTVKEQAYIHSTIKEILIPFYEKLGFTPNKRLCQFQNEKVDVNTSITGNYGYFVTIEPLFVVHFNDILNEVNSLSESHTVLVHNGLFCLNDQLANIFGNHEYDSCKENEYGKNSFRFRIYNEEDVQDFCLKQVTYMKNIGIKFLEKLESVESLYKFYVSLLYKRVENEKNTTLSFLEKGRVIDKELTLTTLMAGIMINAENFDEVVSTFFNHHEGNDYILGDASKLLEKYYV